MQYIAIKKEIKDGKEIFTVSAIPLKNTNKTIVQKIPHPLGSDILTYETLDAAKDAVSLAGFSYILPDGKKGSKPTVKKVTTKESDSYDKLVFDTIKNKINSTNSNITAAAILAISEFSTEETFEILFDKIGEENDLIRKNAISGICRYGKILQNKIIESLKSSNWVTRNSALTCITNLAETGTTELENFITPLCETCNDTNTIVQANAILTLAKVYQNCQKNKKI